MFLRANSAHLSLAELARILGRSTQAVFIRRKRIDAPAPRHAPGYLSCNQISKILGVDSHSPPCWVDRGILQGEPIPYDFGPLKRRVKVGVFKRWLIKPESWLYFKVEKIRVPAFRRLVQLAQKRWGDEWWSTKQAAEYHRVTCSDIFRQIKLGRLYGYRAVGLERRRVQAWAYWFVRRSEIERLEIPTKNTRRNYVFTPAADAFMLRARVEWGYSPAIIARLMKRSMKSVDYRIRCLCRERGITPGRLTAKVPRTPREQECRSCGIGFATKGPRTYYCGKCRPEKKREQARIRDRNRKRNDQK